MFPSTCPGGHTVNYDDAKTIQPDGTLTLAVQLGDVYPCPDCRDFYVLTVFGFRRATDDECEATFHKLNDITNDALARPNGNFLRAL